MNTLFQSMLAATLIFITATQAQDANQAANSNIEGTWQWKFVMPDGAVANPKLTLALKDGKLTGTSSFRAGSETPIVNAVRTKDEIRFQIVRDRDGQDIVMIYSGKWAGNTIKGTIESNWAGEVETYDWEADRAHGAEGSWKWSTAVGERKIEVRATLKQDGAKLAGTLSGRGRGGRGGQPTRIKNGSIKEDGEIYFEVETGFQENRSVTKYKGKLTGDVIQGTVDSNSGGTARKVDWAAQRVN